MALFAAILPAQLLLTLIGRRSLLPPHFLRWVGVLAGLRVLRSGRPAAGRVLLVANHTSWLDILALAGAGNSAFVAKGELAGHPALKWLCEQNDTLFIAREQRGTVARQVAQLRSALARRRMTIFPEGTTGDGTALLPFKSALLSAVEAADPGMTVQPVALEYEEARHIAWHGTEPGGANILRILARLRPVTVTVRFLAPLAEPELANRKAMAMAAERRIAEALALPTLSQPAPMP